MSMIQDVEKIYLCTPDRQILYLLNGVRTETVDLHKQVKDYSELSFEVDRYIVIDGEQVESVGYEDLKAYMYLFIKGIGYFQIQAPTQEYDGNEEHKSVVAYSAEKEFEDKDWLGFKVNTGENDSLEYLASDNKDEFGFAKEYVTIVNSNKELSLLDILLEKVSYWTIGHVDIVVRAMKVPNISLENTNLYAILTSEVGPRLGVLFVFDFLNCQINAYDKNDLDIDTGIFIGFRNLARHVNISVNENSIFTRFRIRGNDNLTIRDWNYDDERYDDLSYFLGEPYMEQELADKIQDYYDFRDTHRETFATLAKECAALNEKIYVLKYKTPYDESYWTNWSNMNEEGLLENRRYYTSLLKSLQIAIDDRDNAEKYTNYGKPNQQYNPKIDIAGNVDHNWYLEKYKSVIEQYGGYYTYFELTHYILPYIELAISNLNRPAAQKQKPTTDASENWDLYGLYELEGKEKEYEDKLIALDKFRKPWSELTIEEKRELNYANEENYNAAGHTMYMHYFNELGNESTQGTIRYKLKELRDELEILEGDYEAKNQQRLDWVDIMKLDCQEETIGNAGTRTAFFTSDEIDLINNLYHDTDYTNSNILTTSIDTLYTTIDREKDLLDDARDKLSEVSQPQYKFSVDLDNLLRIPEFERWSDDFDLLSFIRVGIRDDYSVKLRIMGYTWNPCEIDPNLTIDFSSMITNSSGRSDLTELLNSENNRGSKNSISIGLGNSKTDQEWVNSLLQVLTKNSIFTRAVGGIAANTGGVIDQVSFNELLTNFLNVVDITPDSINVTKITGDIADFREMFTEYLQADVVVSKIVNAEEGVFDNLVADIITVGEAGITQITEDTISTATFRGDQIEVDLAFVEDFLQVGTDHITTIANGVITTEKIEAEMANIDIVNSQLITSESAFFTSLQSITSDSIESKVDAQYVKNLVAGHIKVSDLAAGDITLTDTMQIVSENGLMVMNGTALQISGIGSDGYPYVGVQLGYATNGQPTLILRNEDGATIIDPSGITSDAIADELIVNDMIHTGTITEDRLAFNVIKDTDTISIEQIYMGGEQFGVEYTQFKNGVMDRLNDMMAYNCIVEYAISDTDKTIPGGVLSDDGDVLVDETGAFQDAVWSTELPIFIPEGSYLWTKTTFILGNGESTTAYTVSRNGIDGNNGKDGVYIVRQIPQFYISTSNLELVGGNWMYNKPNAAELQADQFLWGRLENIMSDGTILYSDAYYDSTIGDIIFMVYENERKIVSKIWQTDINNSINEYDRTSAQSIRSRINETISDIDGIHTRIQDMRTIIETKADGTELKNIVNRVHTVEDTASEHTRIISEDILGDDSHSIKSIAQQTAKQFSWIIGNSGSATSTTFTLTPRTASLVAEQINFKGLVTFEGLDYDARKRITDTETTLDTINIYDITTSYTTTNSASTQPDPDDDSIWQENVPVWVNGSYIWQKTITTDKDGVAHVKVVCLTGQRGATGSDAYTIILTNESHTFAGNVDGALASSAECGVIAYKGASQIAASIGTITGMPTGMSVTVSNNNTTSAMFTVTVATTMTTRNGVLSVPITVDGQSFTKEFTYSLALDATTYSIVPSHNVINLKNDHTYAPTSITLTATRQTNGNEVYPYVGRFRFETTTNNTTWTSVQLSSQDELSATYVVPQNIVAMRCSLYLAGGASTLLDQQTIPIISDGVGILSVVTYYYHGATAPSTDPSTDNVNWSTTPQDYIDGYKYWSCVITTFSDGSTYMSEIIEDKGITAAMLKSEKATLHIGMKVNYNTFSTTSDGECYIHGFQNGIAADVDGYIYWNDIRRNVAKTVIDPGTTVPYWATAYIVLRLTNASSSGGTMYIVWYDKASSAWKYCGAAPLATDIPSAWIWVENTDIVLGQFIEIGAEGQIVDAYLYNPPRNCYNITEGMNSYQYSKDAVEWAQNQGDRVVNASTILERWADDASHAERAKINGGMITAQTVNTQQLATDAIMSHNYKFATSSTDPTVEIPDGHFSDEGTYLDLSSGNFYSPNFSIDNRGVTGGVGNAYIRGTVYALAGEIGGCVIENGILQVPEAAVFGAKGGRNLMMNTLVPDVTNSFTLPHVYLGDYTLPSSGTRTAATHGFRITNTTSILTCIQFGRTGTNSSMMGLKPKSIYTFSCDASWKLLSNGTSDTTERWFCGYLKYRTDQSGTHSEVLKKFYTIPQNKRGVVMSGRVEWTFTVPQNTVGLYLQISANDGTASHYGTSDYIELRNIMLEEGSHASTYLPSVEDMSVANVYYNNTTTINGGKIATGTISADKINAQDIISGRLQVGLGDNLVEADESRDISYNRYFESALNAYTYSNAPFIIKNSNTTSADLFLTWYKKCNFTTSTKLYCSVSYIFDSAKTILNNYKLAIRIYYYNNSKTQLSSYNQLQATTSLSKTEVKKLTGNITTSNASSSAIYYRIALNASLADGQSGTNYLTDFSNTAFKDMIVREKLTSNNIAEIGGWTIGSTSLVNGTLGQDNSVYLSTANQSTGTNFAGAGSALTTWRLGIGSRFGVTSNGTLYASNAVISGAITATSLTLGTGVKVNASSVNGLSAVATSGSYNDLGSKPNLSIYISNRGIVSEGSDGFNVDANGLLQASNAVIYGNIYTSEGRIGGLTICDKSIYFGERELFEPDYEKFSEKGPDALTIGVDVDQNEYFFQCQSQTWIPINLDLKHLYKDYMTHATKICPGGFSFRNISYSGTYYNFLTFDQNYLSFTRHLYTGSNDKHILTIENATGSIDTIGSVSCKGVIIDKTQSGYRGVVEVGTGSVNNDLKNAICVSYSYPPNGDSHDVFYVRWDGYVFAVSTNHSSDERYKDIEGTLDYKDLFMAINPIEYTWKDSFNDDSKRHFGVGAQTLEKTIKDLGYENLSIVSYNEENDQYAVNYNELQMLTIPVVQDHEYRIRQLEKENAELREQIRNLLK